MIKLFNSSVYRKAWIFSGLLVLCILWFAYPAMAQSQRDVTSRLNRIENEINTLSRTVYRGGGVPPSSSGGGGAMQANTEVRMQQLEQEIRGMRGSIEEQSHALRQMKTQLDRALADMELRMGDVEKGGSQKLSSGRVGNDPYGGSSSAKAPPKSWVSPAANAQKPMPSSGRLGTFSKSQATGELSASSSDKAAALYENAFAKLKSGQYGAAEKEFQIFISQYPEHVLTSNAKYWLGETFYVRGNYERAARLFAEGYKKYPKGSKAPDNLLKLGMALNGLGSRQDACVAFEQLQKEFAGKSQPVIRRARQEMTRIGCT